MHTLRARFKTDIVTEFLPPLRKMKKQKVIIFASGMPGYPTKSGFIELFARKGYWVFVPRYRGSWESGGTFLKHSPTQDILDVIDALPHGFVSLWDGKRFKVRPDKLFVFGSSFGGPAAIEASLDPRVDKVLLVSPVINWTYPSKTEPLDFMAKFVSAAFGNGYRMDRKGWDKLASGKFYNPMNLVHSVNGDKLLIMHAMDDTVVDYRSVTRFTRETKAQLKLFKRGGHFGTSILLKPAVQKIIQKFL